MQVVELPPESGEEGRRTVPAFGSQLLLSQ